MQPHDVILTEYRGDTRHFNRAAAVYDRTLGRQERMTNDRLGRIDRRWERSTRSILNTRTALSGLTVVVGGAAINQLRRYAEQWRDVERRLESIGATSTSAQHGLIDLAIRTRSAVGGTASAVQRMSKSTGDGLEITTRRVETLQKLLASAGATGTERASVSLQLGQALQSGVLSGDEFRSIRENAPVELLDALASAAGITREELKGFAEQQKLTTAIVLEALDSMAATADAKFGAMSVSGEEAFNVLQSGLVSYVGQVDEALGATETLNGAMVYLGEYASGASEGASTMAASLKIVGSVALAAAGSRGLGALTGAVQKSAKARRDAVTITRDESKAAKQAVIDARQELGARQALRRERQVEYQRREFNNLKSVKAHAQLKTAIVAEQKALDRLAGAQAGARVAADAHSAAQARLSAATRISAAGMKALNGVMAFFGGPVGTAITAITLAVAVMANMKSASDVLEGSLGSLGDTLQKLEGVNQTLAGDYEALEGAQKDLAEATRLGGEAAVDAATLEVDSIQRRITANEQYRRELATLAQVRLAEAKANLAELERAEQDSARKRLAEQAAPDRYRGSYVDRQHIADEISEERARAFTQALREEAIAAADAGEELTDMQRAVLEAAAAKSEASVQVEALEDRVNSLSAAAPVLANGLNDASTSARQLAADAAAAEAGIAGLIAQIPHLKQAAGVQAALAQAESDYQAALSGLNGQGLSGLERIEAERELSDLRRQAVSEITGEAQALRDQEDALENAAAANEAYIRSSEISNMGRREAAIARETDAYSELVTQLREAGAAQGELDAAQAAHEANLARINNSPEKGAGAALRREQKQTERDLADARALLVENGQKQLYIEQELNLERKRLLGLLPELISMGLSRADAEAVLNAELERTKERLGDVKTASERASEEFAKNALRDIRSADNLTDAIGRISDRLLDLAFDKAFDKLAEQFARLSGDGGLGGLFSTIFGGLFGGGSSSAPAPVPGRAQGGRVDETGKIHGPGTGTSDSILAINRTTGRPLMVSNGEGIMTAAAMRKYPDLLDRVNRLQLAAFVPPPVVTPKFAGGGAIDGRAATNAGTSVLQVDIRNYSSGSKVEARPKPDGRGVEVLIQDAVNNGILSGKFNKSLARVFSLRPKAQGK